MYRVIIVVLLVVAVLLGASFVEDYRIANLPEAQKLKHYAEKEAAEAQQVKEAELAAIKSQKAEKEREELLNMSYDEADSSGKFNDWLRYKLLEFAPYMLLLGLVSLFISSMRNRRT